MKAESEKPKPVINLNTSGFSVTEGGRLVSRIDWADVREVVAFKEDLFGCDEICIGFRTSDADSYLRVTEEFFHYEDLLQELPHRFPGIRNDWFSAVAFPAFVPNWTTLWGLPWRRQS